MFDLIGEHTSSLLSAANFMVVLIGLVVAGLYTHRALVAPSSTEYRALAAGIALTAWGLVLHRGYWAFQRAAENFNPSLGETLYKHWTWVTLIPLTVIIVGYTNHLRPILRMVLNGNWRLTFGVYMLALYLALVVVVSGFGL